MAGRGRSRSTLQTVACPLTEKEHRSEQAELLRRLAEQLERGAAELPDPLLEALIQALEDRSDLEDVQARADEPATSWEDFKRELGS